MGGRDQVYLPSYSTAIYHPHSIVVYHSYSAVVNHLLLPHVVEQLAAVFAHVVLVGFLHFGEGDSELGREQQVADESEELWVGEQLLEQLSGIEEGLLFGGGGDLVDAPSLAGHGGREQVQIVLLLPLFGQDFSLPRIYAAFERIVQLFLLEVGILTVRQGDLDFGHLDLQPPDGFIFLPDLLR